MEDTALSARANCATMARSDRFRRARIRHLTRKNLEAFASMKRCATLLLNVELDVRYGVSRSNASRRRSERHLRCVFLRQPQRPLCDVCRIRDRHHPSDDARSLPKTGNGVRRKPPFGDDNVEWNVLTVRDASGMRRLICIGRNGRGGQSR